MTGSGLPSATIVKILVTYPPDVHRKTKILFVCSVQVITDLQHVQGSPPQNVQTAPHMRLLEVHPTTLRPAQTVQSCHLNEKR